MILKKIKKLFHRKTESQSTIGVRVYLDNAATTPVSERVRTAMEPFYTEVFGNPSALHQEGQEAQRAITTARATVATVLGGHPDEVVFTGGGTESNNLAITGVVKTAIARGVSTPHIVTTTIEHPSVRDVIDSLEERDIVSVTRLAVNQEGVISPGDLKDVLTDETVLVSVMYANNEIGTIQPIREVAKIVRAHRKTTHDVFPYVHTDACQAVNYLDINVERLGVDLMTVNGSKIYGPKGGGVLYVRRGAHVSPLMYGGGQERELRPGTENVAGIAGIAEALTEAAEMREEEAERLSHIRDACIAQIREYIPEVRVNGSETRRLPNNINISIPGVDSEQFVIELDAKGIACSVKSACKARDESASHVIIALYGTQEKETGSVRLSLGRSTTQEDMMYAAGVMRDIYNKIKQ